MVDVLQGIIQGFFAGLGFFGAEFVYRKYVEKSLNKIELELIINKLKDLKNNKQDNIDKKVKNHLENNYYK